MENYAKTLISDYNQSIDFFLPTMFNQFSFYSNGSYNVTAIRSSDYGTALLFYPSTKWSFNNQTTDQRIEDAIFGEYNSQLPTKFNFVGKDTGIDGGNLSLDNIGIIIGNDSSAIFKNVNIDSVHYYCLILKGNNRTSYWNAKSALDDSKRIFDGDLYHALDSSEEVREHYAEPELNALLVNILAKWNQALQPNGNVSYTYTQKEYDIKQVEELAKTKYGITNSSQFINSLINYLKDATLPPSPPSKTIFGRPIDDPENWMYVGFLGGLPILDFTFFLVINYYRKKRPSELAKWLFTIPSIILAYVMIDLLYYYPYDYQALSAQTAVVITLWILGPIAVYKGQRKLRLCIVKKNKAQQTDKGANQKSKESIKSKKVK